MWLLSCPAGTAEDLNMLIKDVSALIRENHDIEIAFSVVPSARRNGKVMTGIVAAVELYSRVSYQNGK
jgi:hypothetical protein